MTNPQNWWEPRRDGEATADYLARVLAELGAADLAERARAFHFDDYRCPPEVDGHNNIQRLVGHVDRWSRSSTPERRERARVVIAAAMEGEFDATRAESDAWAASPEGQATLAELLGVDRRGGRS
jgi:hypothetical protein